MEAGNLKRLIGQRIAIARKAADMSQDQVAKAINVHKQTISRWERGERVPNGEEIRLLVELLGCSANFILGLSDTLTVREK
ncbi:helix-turn-helix transcriptional regulator [Olsenella sp. Marseille-P4559]|uniref:helix-turn-helix transcriptional regulator n=1 Tax=Olsenella sp. Marseille-P4559 TaxID=2364795 RepID=UPI001030A6CA|nr:helix-turn-helix transcriptional regulator [Olsenella sp. Marseille-P4559]